MREMYGYYERASMTPVLDAIETIIGVASVVIGGYAAIFMAIAIRDGNANLAFKNSLFLLAVALANGALSAARRWRRRGLPSTRSSRTRRAATWRSRA